uniref:Uncharacterized protein n=1 Tax=Solanum lycopersicum TaxID=4081 RepID=A0A494G8L3_SOLLC
MVGQRRAWHHITAIGLHARSDNVGRGMTSPPLDSTHDLQHRAWHDITTLGQHTRSIKSAHTVGRRGAWHDITALRHLACHYRLWVAHMVKQLRAWPPIIAIGRRRAWHDIIAFRRGMPSSPLGSTNDNVGRGMTSSPLGNTHDRTTSGVACHHRLWVAQMVERRQAWDDISALGLHTRSDTSTVACHHRLWTGHTIERRQAWHAIIAFG